jgi:FKBP-type peptidyl-prolyl cis-trans isomerase FkpA
MKMKNIALVLFLAFAFAACKKEDNVDTFDYEGQYRMDTTAIRSFVRANNIPAIKDTSSGIFYQIIAPGSGNVTYAGNTLITADYVGKLLDGTVFDSAAAASPLKQRLGNLIVGWQFGIQKIQKGGKIRLLVPSFWAYGNQSLGKVPANSVLDFTINLQDATN